MSNNETSALRRGLSVLGQLLGGSRRGPSGERARHLGKLQKRIGIRFTDLSLLEQALTHRSYSHVTAQTRNDSNERMEFLGDSVLGLCVSQFLYLEYTDRSEGALSKMKSLLVSRKVLSLVSRNIGLGEYVLLSGEESDMGGRDRTSILADSFEGLIGAIYLDQGYRAANRFIRRFLLADINDILKDEDHTNFKSLLQEYVQSKRLSHPVYRVRKEEGPEHEKEFAVDVVVRGDIWGSGRGKSKKDAEQSAARAALESRQGKLAGRPTTTGPTRSEGGKPRRGARSADVASAGAAVADEKAAAVRPARARRARGEHGLEASRKRLEEERLNEDREAKAADRQERPARARRRPEAAQDAASGDSAGNGESGGPRRSRRGRRRRGGAEDSTDAPPREREVVSREELRAESRRPSREDREAAEAETPERESREPQSREPDSRESLPVDSDGRDSEGRSGRRSGRSRSRRSRRGGSKDEAPAASESPAASDSPVRSESPVASDSPVRSESPVAQESPVRSESPSSPSDADSRPPSSSRRGRRPRRTSSRPSGASAPSAEPAAPESRAPVESRAPAESRPSAESRTESRPRVEAQAPAEPRNEPRVPVERRDVVEVESGSSSEGFTPRRKRTSRGSRR